MDAGAGKIYKAIPHQGTKLRQCEAIRSELNSVDVGLDTVEHWSGSGAPMGLLLMLIHTS